MIPQDFIAEIKKWLPEEEVPAFLETCEKPLKKTISLCLGKITPEQFLAITKPRGWHLTPSHLKTNETVSAWYIDRDDTSTALGKTFLYQGGFFYIQELSASLPAAEILPMPGARLLDMASAPGGKTTQLAHACLVQGGRPGVIVANDIASDRIKTTAHNLNMMGAYNTVLTKRNGAMFGTHLPEFFDAVLLDAPCSGEGTRYKSDSALSFRRKEEVNKITGTQLQLLISAVKTCKPGGHIVYSTCTLNPYENEQLLNRVLEFFPNTLTIEPVHIDGASSGITSTDFPCSFDPTAVARCRPHRQHTGGFFIAKIRKIASTQSAHASRKESKFAPKNPFSLQMGKSLFTKVSSRLQTTFGIGVDPERYWFVASKEQVYVCSPDCLPLLDLLHMEKVGVPIAKIDGEQLRPLHALGNILGHLATKHVLEFSDEMMQQYSQQQDIILPTVSLSPKTPYYIIQRRGFGMSVIKLLPTGYKNKRGK